MKDNKITAGKDKYFAVVCWYNMKHRKGADLSARNYRRKEI